MDMEEADTKIKTKSFHLIGIEDQIKGKSEEISSLYKNAHVMYFSGGHTISREQRSDNE